MVLPELPLILRAATGLGGPPGLRVQLVEREIAEHQTHPVAVTRHHLRQRRVDPLAEGAVKIRERDDRDRSRFAAPERSTVDGDLRPVHRGLAEVHGDSGLGAQSLEECGPPSLDLLAQEVRSDPFTKLRFIAGQSALGRLVEALDLPVADGARFGRDLRLEQCLDGHPPLRRLAREEPLVDHRLELLTPQVVDLLFECPELDTQRLVHVLATDRLPVDFGKNLRRLRGKRSRAHPDREREAHQQQEGRYRVAASAASLSHSSFLHACRGV